MVLPPLSPLSPFSHPAQYISNIDTVFILKNSPTSLVDFDKVNASRATRGLAPLSPHVLPDSLSTTCNSNSTPNSDSNSNSPIDLSKIQPQSNPNEFVPSFDGVVLGGTFDRLHAGHKMMLTVATLICRKHMEVGVSSEALLGNKKFKELIEPYERRRDKVLNFVRTLNPDPNLNVVMIHLVEPYANTTTSKLLKAIVVSPETEKVGAFINSIRSLHSPSILSSSQTFKPPIPPTALDPLEVISIRYVAPPAGLGDQAQVQLSSTLLRQRDYQKLHNNSNNNDEKSDSSSSH